MPTRFTRPKAEFHCEAVPYGQSKTRRRTEWIGSTAGFFTVYFAAFVSRRLRMRTALSISSTGIYSNRPW